MAIRGEMFVGGMPVVGPGEPFRAFDPARRVELEPAFGTASAAQVDQACALAQAAAAAYGATAPEQRAVFLERIAARLEAGAEQIVGRAKEETGLPEPRVRGELARTCGQLRLFARVARDGAWLDARIDHAQPARTPPRPDIRLVNQPVGPVAVFGASNFPLAFSVAGGDTASAFAAGCPVIVKAHHAHPGTSELAGRAIVEAVAECGLPPGTFALLFGSGVQTGCALVADPRVMAVGFTGSRRGGTALMAIAQARRQPIPVYAEMSSINPVLLLPGALAERGAAIGSAFAASLTLGAGQFCTNPGLLLALDGPGLGAFLEGTRAALASIAPATMLTPGIHEAYCRGVAALAANPRVKSGAQGPTGAGLVSEAHVFETSASDFLADPRLSEEVFGATALLVRCAGAEQLLAVVDALDGQLTAAVHAASSDMALAATVLPRLERRVGRVIFNGFGTGVEVCDAMVHGGPYPATSDGRSTSVGSLAIMRFVRPVSYQDVPAELLPPPLREENPWRLPRRVDGVRA
ncbi:MAG TPA: aldehyde dehydrogenase (NADP(+)) [Steroidobacteraceae bacterium]|nr:aldehyde dehydrogenase (NADP(+)) [Steroidobacteraceae bacterium]